MKENLSEELRATRRLLHEISQMCEHATLTGSLGGGAPRTVARYNSILARLVSEGAVPEGLFTSLAENSEYGEIGVEARMLASYIREGEKEKDKNRSWGVHDPGILTRLAPFVDSADLSALIREQMQKGVHMDMHILTSIAPFLGKQDLSMLLREQLNSNSDRRERGERPGRPERPDRPERPERPERSRDQFPSNMGWPFTNDDQPQATESSKLSLDEALERLREPNLSDEERDLLIRQVRELATE